MKILIVEDSKPALDIISYIIKKVFPGVSLDIAMTGLKGIEFICSKTYDLIFCDYQLPDQNGNKVVLKAIETKQPAKIIGISSSSQYNSELVRLGACGSIEKNEFLILAKYLYSGEEDSDFTNDLYLISVKIQGIIA